MGDIQAMFHQVKVTEEDRDFLWWPEGDLTKEVAKFRMTVHLFWCCFPSELCHLCTEENGS